MLALWYTHSLDIRLNVMDTTHHISYIQQTKLHARRPSKYNIKLFPYYDIIFESPMHPNECNNHQHTPHIHIGGDLATVIHQSLHYATTTNNIVVLQKYESCFQITQIFIEVQFPKYWLLSLILFSLYLQPSW